MSESLTAKLSAGVPATNNTLLWRLGFHVGDPVALLEFHESGQDRSILILRDIELERARQTARADACACPADFAPAGGLSGDRETATAQAAAECLRREGVTAVTADRTLPLIFAEYLRRDGIDVACDPELWVIERRQKTVAEIDFLREAQSVTEDAMRFACEMIARAEAKSGGILFHDGQPLTSERVRRSIDVFLMERGFSNPTSIVAGGPVGADCHHVGAGQLLTGTPVIVDIFPRCRRTRYWGDCTRTVVHGEIPDEIRRMHATVCQAKAAATEATAAGTSGEEIHRAATAVIRAHGYSTGLPPDDAPPEYCSMVHGTGHGIGLDVHEPPLLDMNGPVLLAGDAITIEPGLYRRDLGGVRVEDMVIVTQDGATNLNRLSEQLAWSES